MGCSNVTKAFQGSTCKNGMGGIKNLWLGAFEDGIKVAFDAEGYVDSVVDSGDTPIPFWKFTLPVDIGNANENITADPTLGTAFVELEINGTLLGLRSTYSAELTKMMRGKQIILAELYTKQIPAGETEEKTVYVLYGYTNGVDLTAGGSRTGDAGASLQGYELTWTGKEREYAPFTFTVTSGSDPTDGDFVTVG